MLAFLGKFLAKPRDIMASPAAADWALLQESEQSA
jgi:hypothetical protein